MEILEKETNETQEIEMSQRKNPFCVISKDTIEVVDINEKKHYLHMIETNSSWSENPYGEKYAVVPDDMVQEIQATRGFCDIVLNEDETEVVSFTALEIPEIPVAEVEPTAEQKEIKELRGIVATQSEEIAMLTECCADLLYNQSLIKMEV